MDIFFLLGCIGVGLLILGYIVIKSYLYRYRNPVPRVIASPSKSTVTHSYLGRRGDMGNQMFQLACLIAAAGRSDARMVVPPRIDNLPMTGLFDLEAWPRATIVPDQTYYEYDNYERIEIPRDGLHYDIRGYRQAYAYFEDAADSIRKIFTPKAEILDQIRKNLPSQYIAIHIRRGDYIKTIHQVPLLREFKQCQLAYYQAGIRHLRAINPELPVIVCTDSPKWVAPLLPELDPHAILAPTVATIAPKFSDFCTLYLATGVVISNSTYSWWAAYLRNQRPVVCPTPWWDPRGFIGTGMGLNGPYLHYPEWWLLDADTGAIKRTPHSLANDVPDTNSDTLDLYRMIRGVLL